MEAISLGKYGESLGIWKLNLNGVDIELKPRKGDNYRFLEFMNNARKTNNESQMLKDFGLYLKGLVERDCPPTNDQEKEDLELAIEFNIAKLLEETMIKFRWTTKEKFNEMSSSMGNAGSPLKI